MKFYVALPVFLFGLTLPVVASASVLINEIAWMGTLESSTNEWIELANTGGTSVDVSGWTLVAEDGTPRIVLSGSIAPDGYYLIERTDDTTVPGVAADLVASFGSGLSNGGETLILKDASGNVVDMVVGGTNWTNVGGDNTTKETAQRSGSGWITAMRTPRMLNVGGVTASTTPPPPLATTTLPLVSGSNTSDTGTPVSAGSGSVWKTPLSKYPRANMFLEAGEDRRVFVGFPVEFAGHALGLYDEPLPYATYRWNWGDGSVGAGATTTHIYRHAGEYLVTCEAINGQLRSLTRLNAVVTAPPITIDKIIPGDEGALFLRNTSSREVDLSGWMLREEGGVQFIIPEHTFLLSGKTFILGNEITALAHAGGQKIVLTYPNGVEAAMIESPHSSEKGGDTTETQRSTVNKSVPAAHLSFPKKISENPPLLKHIQTPDASSTVMTAASVLWDGGQKIQSGTIPSSGFMKWWILLSGAILFVVAGVVALRSTAEPVMAKDYAIFEEIDDGKDDL